MSADLQKLQQMVYDLEALYHMGKPGHVTELHGILTVIDASSQTTTKVYGQFKIAFTGQTKRVTRNGVSTRMCRFMLLEIQETGVTYHGCPDNPCLPIVEFIGKLGNVCIESNGAIAFFIGL